MASRWPSEESWRGTLDGCRGMVRELTEHVFFNKERELDQDYTNKRSAMERRRFERIFAQGEPEWQERYPWRPKK